MSQIVENQKIYRRHNVVLQKHLHKSINENELKLTLKSQNKMASEWTTLYTALLHKI